MRGKHYLELEYLIKQKTSFQAKNVNQKRYSFVMHQSRWTRVPTTSHRNCPRSMKHVTGAGYPWSFYTAGCALTTVVRSPNTESSCSPRAKLNQYCINCSVPAACRQSSHSLQATKLLSCVIQHLPAEDRAGGSCWPFPPKAHRTHRSKAQPE